MLPLQIEIKSKSMCRAILSLLLAKHYSPSTQAKQGMGIDALTDSYYTEWKWLQIDVEEKIIGANDREHEGRTTITFEQLFTSNILDTVSSISIRLNREYTAVVMKDTVRVGCQKFHASVINELSSALVKLSAQ